MSLDRAKKLGSSRRDEHLPVGPENQLTPYARPTPLNKKLSSLVKEESPEFNSGGGGSSRGCTRTPRTRILLALLLALTACLPLSTHAAATLADHMERNEPAKVAQLLQSGAEVNAAQPDGTTALIWAAHHADADTVARLLAKGANPNVKNDFGMSPIALACRNADLRSFEHLLAAGAKHDVKDAADVPLLFLAVRSGNADLVARLVELGADVNASIWPNQTALMWAASEGHDIVVEFLIQSGADPKAATKDGFTAIHFAARAGHIPTIQHLLGAGVDVNTPMQWTGQKFFRDPLDQTSPLILAIENAKYAAAIALLKAGANPNDVRTGFTPLHTMTWVRKAHTGDGSDPEPINYGKITSIQFIDVLVEYGADVNLRDKNDETPFFAAARRSDYEMMQRLVDHGADPKLVDKEGTTALHVAAGVGRGAENDQAGTQEEAIKSVALCLKLGLDINAVSKVGDTAMHGAAYGQWPDMVHFLHENGADIQVWNTLNKHRWSPLLIAQGYRWGNFKPSYDTIDAIEAVMAAQGVTLRYDPPEEKKGY